jgi:hypothetical protein
MVSSFYSGVGLMIKLNRTTSTYLDILRILCAQLVLIGHNRSFLGLQAWARALHAPFVQSLAVSFYSSSRVF